MAGEQTLDQYLKSWAGKDRSREDLCTTIKAIVEAGVGLAGLISRHGITKLYEVAEEHNASGDTQKPLDIIAHNAFEEALLTAPVAYLVSEEKPEPVMLNPDCSLTVAIDPLDGSSNIESNMSIGSIFSVIKLDTDQILNIRPGERQIAAGFLVYGPQTSLVLSCGNGTQIFTLERESSVFLQVGKDITIPPEQREFAINTSNYRFWDGSIRYFVDDCLAGKDGPLDVDYNMRWNASLVAEAFRIMVRGGVFLYPSDSRPGYEKGRLRFLYEALPLAFLIEQAGGDASDGIQRILDIELSALHQRVPLIFGSKDIVTEVINYISGESIENTRFPLFEKRSLLRN